MNYEAWRATFQSSEQAAQAAFQDAQRNHEMLLNTLTRCNELDANLQRIIEAATAEGPGPQTQAAIDEMPAHSLAQRDAEKQAEALELVKFQSGPHEDTPQEDDFDAGWDAAFELLGQRAEKLRRQASGGSQ